MATIWDAASYLTQMLHGRIPSLSHGAHLFLQLRAAVSVSLIGAFQTADVHIQFLDEGIHLITVIAVLHPIELHTHLLTSNLTIDEYLDDIAVLLRHLLYAHKLKAAMPANGNSTVIIA